MAITQDCIYTQIYCGPIMCCVAILFVLSSVAIDGQQSCLECQINTPNQNSVFHVCIYLIHKHNQTAPITINISALSSAPEGAIFEFEYPNLTNNSLTLRENTTVQVEFTLKNINCVAMNDILIEIGSYFVELRLFKPHCNILQKDGDCLSFDNVNVSCKCVAKGKSFIFTKTMQRSDNKIWKWAVIGGRADDFIIQFNVIYPGRVLDLTLNVTEEATSFVQQNHSISVVCTWENGNPPSSVHLLDANRKPFYSSNKSGITSYQIQGACYETILVYCDVNFSNKNMSAALTIKCPPKVSKILQNSTGAAFAGNAEFKVQVKAHTSYIRECRLSHYSVGQYNPFMNTSSATFTTEHLCSVNGHLAGSFLASQQKSISDVSDGNSKKCRCTLGGTVPDLLLHVDFYDVRRREDGRWKLFFANDFGELHLDAFLKINEGSPVFVEKMQEFLTSFIGHNSSITFPVHANTSRIAECSISRCHIKFKRDHPTFTEIDGKNYSCTVNGLAAKISGNREMNVGSMHQQAKCECTVNDTAHDQTIVIYIVDVTKHDVGQWCLTVSADSGSDSAGFFLNVIDGETPAVKADDSTRWRWIAIVVSVITVAVIFIIRAMRRNNILSRRIESSSLSGQAPTESGGHMASSVTSGDDAGNIPQTTLNLAGSEMLCNVQQQLCQHAPREESGVRLMCQGGDIMQILLLVRGRPHNPETPQLEKSSSQYSLLDPSVSADRQETFAMVTNRQLEDYLTPCMHSYRTLPPLRGGNQNITALSVYEAGKEVAPALPQASSMQSESVATPDINVHYCEESQYVTIE